MSTKTSTNQQSLGTDLMIDGNTPQLYEHCVKPFLLHCSQVWCLGKLWNYE